jgi:hypothetical protein
LDGVLGEFEHGALVWLFAAVAGECPEYEEDAKSAGAPQ